MNQSIVYQPHARKHSARGRRKTLRTALARFTTDPWASLWALLIALANVVVFGGLVLLVGGD